MHTDYGLNICYLKISCLKSKVKSSNRDPHYAGRNASTSRHKGNFWALGELRDVLTGIPCLLGDFYGPSGKWGMCMETRVE